MARPGAAQRRPVVVPDVQAFPGHIACDPASASELVLPILRDGRLLGVLDLDSPRTGRFGDADRDGLAPVAGLLATALDWPDWIGQAQ